MLLLLILMLLDANPLLLKLSLVIIAKLTDDCLEEMKDDEEDW